ncbi:MAG: LysM peptidoglycan-binding domain-containing protein [Deltaproteobacteria bacterium]|nr:LysM peptidoglycan-binding domain-containing protein [Deltaproteobacteria bacterium]
MTRSSALGVLATLLLLPAIGAAEVPWTFDKTTPSIKMQETAKSGERTHVVQAGDTLWSIAEGYYDEPWYWPSLWSYNPQITNPHLIYPGDVVYLSRRRAPMTKRKAITFAASRFARRQYTPVTLARRVGYISARDYRESGVIEGSREERAMLGTLDEVYTRFALKRCNAVEKTTVAEAAKAEEEGREADLEVAGPCVRDGDRYVVYRVERPIRHPHSGKTIGYKINFVGEGEVVNTRREIVGMVLTKAHAEIGRGDLVTNLFEPLTTVSPRPNESELVGTIVDFHHETVATGQHSYVYIDKGAAHGVKRGNRFEIVWRGDGLRGSAVRDIKQYPDEQIGIAMVVEAYDQHSLAYLTHSVRELERGMAAIMPKGF